VDLALVTICNDFGGFTGGGHFAFSSTPREAEAVIVPCVHANNRFCKEGSAIASHQLPASVWKRAKGLPAGTEYRETDGCVSVRLWRGDCYQIEGPADLRGGSIEELVHMLLDQIRSTD
jgi:hypothetical protein